MLGPFRPTSSLSGGLLWKRPWRLSKHQKARARKRLKLVDGVVATLDRALTRHGMSNPAVAADPAATTTSSSQTASSEPATSSAAEESILNSDPAAPTSGGARRVSGRTASATAHTPSTDPSAASTGGRTMKAIERWKAEMPTEGEMLPRDKYTMFDRKEKNYRKGIHKLPKWTRVSQRINPPGF